VPCRLKKACFQPEPQQSAWAAEVVVRSGPAAEDAHRRPVAMDQRDPRPRLEGLTVDAVAELDACDQVDVLARADPRRAWRRRPGSDCGVGAACRLRNDHRCGSERPASFFGQGRKRVPPENAAYCSGLSDIGSVVGVTRADQRHDSRLDRGGGRRAAAFGKRTLHAMVGGAAAGPACKRGSCRWWMSRFPAAARKFAAASGTGHQPRKRRRLRQPDCHRCAMRDQRARSKLMRWGHWQIVW